MAPSPTVHRTQVDGIPAFWTTGGGGPCVGALLFRVGHADETLANSGISHLVEHLALSTIGEQPYEYNGQIESSRAIFYAQGSPEQVAEFLSRTAWSLSDLPLDRLESERRVLLTEEASRGILESSASSSNAASGRSALGCGDTGNSA